MMRAILFAISLTSCAQTVIPPGQVKGTPSATGQVMVATPTGSATWALLGDSISLDTSDSRPVLRVSLPAGSRLARIKAVASATPAQSYSIAGVSDPSQILVFRNGLLQADGEDYDASGGTITFRNSAVQSGDIVQLVALL
jgi:hypothetical protein